jgi:hypothetical protein
MGTRRVAERVLEGIGAFVERRLKLRINRSKSGVAPSIRRGLLGFGFFTRDGAVKVRIDHEALQAAKARIRIGALNRFSWSGAATSPGPRLRRSSPSSTSGSVGGFASASGSSGRSRLGSAHWFGWASSGTRPGSGPTPARDRGGWRDLPSCPAPCPTRTGRPWASSVSPRPTVAFGMSGEPPDAWSACPVEWEGAGQPSPYPIWPYPSSGPDLGPFNRGHPPKPGIRCGLRPGCVVTRAHCQSRGRLTYRLDRRPDACFG